MLTIWPALQLLQLTFRTNFRSSIEDTLETTGHEDGGFFARSRKILYLSSITGLEIVVTSDTKIIWKQRRTCLSSREESTIRWLTSNNQLNNLGSNQTRVCSVLMNAVKSSISLKLYFMSILQTQNVMRLMISGRRHYCGTLSEPLRSLVMHI